MAGLSRSGPALSDIQIRDKVKEVRRIDKQGTRRAEGGLITVEVGPHIQKKITFVIKLHRVLSYKNQTFIISKDKLILIKYYKIYFLQHSERKRRTAYFVVFCF